MEELEDGQVLIIGEPIRLGGGPLIGLNLRLRNRELLRE